MSKIQILSCIEWTISLSSFYNGNSVTLCITKNDQKRGKKKAVISQVKALFSKHRKFSTIESNSKRKSKR